MGERLGSISRFDAESRRLVVSHATDFEKCLKLDRTLKTLKHERIKAIGRQLQEKRE